MAKHNLMSIKKTTDLIRIITDLGYTQAKLKPGSHMIFKANGRPTLSIPDNREIAPGTLRNLVKLITGNEYYNRGQ